MCSQTFCKCKVVYALPCRATANAACGVKELYREKLGQLLDSWVADARRHGVPGSRVVSWVRRKLGGDITVYRCRQDGSLGRATPCLLCSRELARFDLRVHCPLDDGAWFCGRVTDCGAPEAVLTSGQRRMIKGKGCGKR
ncbi:hypothetical protein H632_c1061p0 [Helicosporidium sp. ATCC 50920]|nr:hypothetical protein H632_c1061p0 [Helicosporidium sp. ATCC 50920]|eukprot:KDD74807.1 hypothetical protein H632_c1061p0 [Helicosporidium sp. ATCC 50920]